VNRFVAGMTLLLSAQKLHHFRFRAVALCLIASSTMAAEKPTIPAGELVRKTVENELHAGNDSRRFMFRVRKQTSDGSQTRLYVQTREATAGKLVALDDKPLSVEQKQAEEGHLQYLIKNPEEIRRKQRQEKDDAERISRIVRALPDAFVYEYEGTEAGASGVGKAGNELVRLKFRPNPNYDPPTRVEQVLTGMAGYVVIDANRERIAKIDGTLFKDVSFGWGFFGHLDRGGQFQVDQGEVADSGWEITRMKLNFTGKILLFKSISIKKSEVYSDFQAVPANLTFAQGVELLQRQESQKDGKNNGGR
jgi:hypothetical protein